MLLFYALFALLFYDFLNTFCRFQTMYLTVRRWQVANQHTDRNGIERICATVNCACTWYPKQALCLQRTFVTVYLLRKHGVNALMVLGAQVLPFKAHAWVEVEGRPVNERSDVQAIYGIWDRC